MIPKVIEVVGDEPITVAEARAHLEAHAYNDSDIDPTDDTMIEGWLGAAREYCEGYLGLTLRTAILEVALDGFPSHRHRHRLGIDLPGGPVREVLSIAWGDESDQEMAAADFLLDSYKLVHAAHPVSLAGWPFVTRATNAIKIRYLAGYGVDSDGGEQLPRAIRAAMLLVLGHLYANRENTNDIALQSIPLGAEALMRPFQVRLGMA